MSSHEITTVASEAPITKCRLLPVNLPDRVENPGLPRANTAPTFENPNVSYYKGELKNYSVLQQHISYFDRNKNGIIAPIDTFMGFWNLGFNFIICILGTVIINGTMAYSTQTSYLPDPRFHIHVKNIHRAKHGSDTETYDTEGRFVPEKFEEVFSKYALSDPSKKTLTPEELLNMIIAQRNAFDLFGITAAFLEWTITYLLIGGDGKVKKEDVRGIIDGSLFYKIAEDRKKKSGYGSFDKNYRNVHPSQSHSKAMDELWNREGDIHEREE